MVNAASTSTDNSVYFGDTTPPGCAVQLPVGRPPGTVSGHSEMDVQATDAQSGLASITKIVITNGTTSITPLSPFAPGTKSALLTALKTDESKPTSFSFTVTDVAGNTRNCR